MSRICFNYGLCSSSGIPTNKFCYSSGTIPTINFFLNWGQFPTNTQFLIVVNNSRQIKLFLFVANDSRRIKKIYSWGGRFPTNTICYSSGTIHTNKIMFFGILFNSCFRLFNSFVEMTTREIHFNKKISWTLWNQPVYIINNGRNFRFNCKLVATSILNRSSGLYSRQIINILFNGIPDE